MKGDDRRRGLHQPAPSLHAGHAAGRVLRRSIQFLQRTTSVHSLPAQGGSHRLLTGPNGMYCRPPCHEARCLSSWAPGLTINFCTSEPNSIVRYCPRYFPRASPYPCGTAAKKRSRRQLTRYDLCIHQTPKARSRAESAPLLPAEHTAEPLWYMVPYSRVGKDWQTWTNKN
jgi:hypothetical protein